MQRTDIRFPLSFTVFRMDVRLAGFRFEVRARRPAIWISALAASKKQAA